MNLSRRRGRPRSASTDARILAAAQRLLIEGGYSRFTLEAVAEMARVSRPSIYRRYTSKVELVTDALSSLPDLVGGVPEGECKARLVWLLHLFLDLEKQLDPWALLGTVLVEERRHPRWLALVRERLIAPRRALLRSTLESGVETGEVRADIDLDTAVDLLTGPIFTRRIALGRFPTDWPEALLDVVWLCLKPATSNS